MFKALLSLLTILCLCTGAYSHASTTTFKSSIQDIPLNMQTQMKKYTWHPGCPIPLNQLAYVQLSFWGFDHQSHQGVLIVNKDLANEVVAIFKKLYQHHFPIKSMLPIEVFKGNDDASMAANNTSAFNCRDLTNKPGLFSQHSYGRAIDINPLINPFLDGQQVLPAQGLNFLNRNKPAPGKIIKKDYVFKLFTQKGWDWGANWYDVQDFQHFEKRANGEKRNPYGNWF